MPFESDHQSKTPDVAGNVDGISGRLCHILGITRSELRPVFWASLYFFFLLAGYYVIRPIRDAMGLTGGIHDLKWLFFVTLAVMVVANPLFAALVSRFPRRIFVPTVYLFFIMNLLVFFGLFRWRGVQGDINVARAFFIWVSVFNLFAVSLFWGMMADVFRAEQGQRLFALISVGGTVGAIVGSTGTMALARRIGEVNLLPLSAILLGAACYCVVRMNVMVATDAGRETAEGNRRWAAREDQRIGGSLLSGITHLFLSPFLSGIALFIVFYSFSSTLIYFLQGTIVQQELVGRDTRAEFFAMIDLSVNLLAIVLQVFLAGRIIKKLGVGLALLSLPLVVLSGFLALAVWPSLVVLFVFQVVRRAANYALARPARESLFTVVPREDKYKAKNLIDTVAYRGGDATGVTCYSVLTSQWVGLASTTVLWLFCPIIGLWCLLSIFLGRAQRTLADTGPPERNDSIPKTG